MTLLYHYTPRILGVLLAWHAVAKPMTCQAEVPHRIKTGWVEKVIISPPRMVIHAKLDTGAATSSLGATDIEEFKKNGESWVRFKITNRYAENLILERRVQRVSIIKRHLGKYQKRQVIRLGICLGDLYMVSEVNLIDRSNFQYQMLIGRNFLAGNIIVDTSATYTLEPRCAKQSK